MSLSINTNAAAENAWLNLNNTDAAESQSIAKLSSGSKITSAADDPAGLAVSQNLQAQVGGLGAAITNSNDAINMLKTTDGALSEVSSILQTMRNLAVSASNTGALDSTAVSADQTQVTSAIQSLNRIASNTAFGNKKLLDGSGSMTGTVMDATDMTNINSASSGSSLVSGYGSLQITQQATKASTTGSTVIAGGTGAIANAAGGTITINGTAITVATTDTVQDVINNINAQKSTTGVTASWDGVNNKLKLNQGSYGSNNIIAYTESATIFNGGNTSVSAGVDAHATVVQGTTTTQFTAGKGNLLQDAAGDSIQLNGAPAAGAAVPDAFYMNGSSLTFQVGANAGQTTSISIAGTAANNLGTNNGTTSTASVANIDLTSNASDAITVLDAAIAQISTQRASIGAAQQGLQSNVNSLSVAQQNIQSSESSITDTDMASEMVNFTRDQVMMQAGSAMLTQANQMPQNIISILKG
jgi:flagellin